MSRPRTTRRPRSNWSSRALTLGAALFSLLTASVTWAGDPTAHTAATVRAASAVANLPEFAAGVGSPEFVIPTGTPSERFCPYDANASYGDGSCAYSDRNGRASNEPDDWSCLDLRQPPAVSLLNSSVSLTESVLATLLSLGTSQAATACNWNHFLNNPALGPFFSAPATAAFTRDWADEIPAAIERHSARWSCNVYAFETYYNRVVNALHYVQDMQTEQHVLGNQVCTSADVLPSQDFDQLYSFSAQAKCDDFLATTKDEIESSDINCDFQLSAPLGALGSHRSLLARGLGFVCDLGSSFACMGLERLMRHHCNLPNQAAKSITCFGPPDDHEEAISSLQYCEGEIYNRPGEQDFLTLAATASIDPLASAMRRWARACPAPPAEGPPEPPENVAASIGDPHLATFDGVQYDFQTYGECTLARDTADGIEIQTRMQPYRGSSSVAVNVGLAAQVGADSVAFYLGDRSTLNHTDLIWPQGKTTLSGGGTVYRAGRSYIVVWPQNLAQLRFGVAGEYISPRLYVANALRGKWQGPLGNINGATNDELFTSLGAPLAENPISFEVFQQIYVESWRVGDHSLFDYPSGQNSEDFTDRSFPSLLGSTALLDATQQATAGASCAALGVAPAWTSACLLDVGMSGDPSFASILATAPPVTASIEISPPATSGGGLHGEAGAPCVTGNQCGTGICGVGGRCAYGTSCLAILEANPLAPSGTYRVAPGGASPFQAYCDMTSDGGGWTRVVGINPSDHNHVASAAVNAAGLTAPDAIGKFSDDVINALKSGSDPSFRLTCKNSATPVTGYFSPSCVFSASPTPNANGACTQVAYAYQQPEPYGHAYTQSCVVGLADGDHGAGERLIYGANAAICNNQTTGCDTGNAHWGGTGSLWVR